MHLVMSGSDGIVSMPGQPRQAVLRCEVLNDSSASLSAFSFAQGRNVSFLLSDEVDPSLYEITLFPLFGKDRKEVSIFLSTSLGKPKGKRAIASYEYASFSDSAKMIYSGLKQLPRTPLLWTRLAPLGPNHVMLYRDGEGKHVKMLVKSLLPNGLRKDSIPDFFEAVIEWEYLP